MTDQEMLDNLKQIQAEAQDALKKDNKAALDKALADYDGKFEEYEKQLNRIEASVRTAELGLSGGADPKDAAARKAFNTFIRSGEVMDAMVAGNDSQGGYLVPEVQATEILKLATVAPLDFDAVAASVRKTGRIVVAEETSDRGCVADELFARLGQAQIPFVGRKKNLGRRFVTHGATAILLREAGLDADGIVGLIGEVCGHEA